MASNSTVFILSFAKSLRNVLPDTVNYGEIFLFVLLLLCLGIAIAVVASITKTFIRLLSNVSSALVTGAVAFIFIAATLWITRAPEELMQSNDVFLHLKWSVLAAQAFMKQLITSISGLKTDM